jgi:hypothetical protein
MKTGSEKHNMIPSPLLKRRLLLHFAAFLASVKASSDVFQLQKLSYDPPSATACRVVLNNVRLACTNNSTGVTSPKCYASNLPFLATLALCIDQHATNITSEEMETWWSKTAVGWASNQPTPSVAMAAAIYVADSPTLVVNKGELLSNASLISTVDYQSAYDWILSWNKEESFHAIFA